MTRAEFAAVPLAGALIAGEIAAAPAAPFRFDRAMFERRASLPFRHRQMFASRALNSGVVLHLMANSIKAYESPDGFGEGPGSLHAAAVLYGTSLTALLDDGTWNSLRLAPFLQRLGDLAAGSPVGNPFSEVVTALNAAKASFFVCNNSLHDVAHALAANGDAEMVYQILRRGVRSEALIVPAGVATLNALAERRFTAVQASV